GTVAVGIFSSDFSWFTQLKGSLSMGLFAFVFSAIVFGILKFTLGVRVSPEEEMMGLDISEHGMAAYSGFDESPKD
ncbi:MAG: ammonium transporter, partial [Planctomycetota bacterium]